MFFYILKLSLLFYTAHATPTKDTCGSLFQDSPEQLEVEINSPKGFSQSRLKNEPLNGEKEMQEIRERLYALIHTGEFSLLRDKPLTGEEEMQEIQRLSSDLWGTKESNQLRNAFWNRKRNKQEIDERTATVLNTKEASQLIEVINKRVLYTLGEKEIYPLERNELQEDIQEIDEKASAVSGKEEFSHSQLRSEPWNDEKWVQETQRLSDLVRTRDFSQSRDKSLKHEEEIQRLLSALLDTKEFSQLGGSISNGKGEKQEIDREIDTVLNTKEASQLQEAINKMIYDKLSAAGMKLPEPGSKKFKEELERKLLLFKSSPVNKK